MNFFKYFYDYLIFSPKVKIYLLICMSNLKRKY